MEEIHHFLRQRLKTLSITKVSGAQLICLFLFILKFWKVHFSQKVQNIWFSWNLVKIIKFSDFSENGGNSPLFAPGAENAMNYQGFWSQISTVPVKKYSSGALEHFYAKSAKMWFSWTLVKITKFSEFHDFGLQNHYYSLVLAVFFAFGEKGWN